MVIYAGNGKLTTVLSALALKQHSLQSFFDGANPLVSRYASSFT
jgi:hypothetical protein